MLLYHGSKAKFDKIKKSQARSPYAHVPEGELLDAIYLTPQYKCAVSMGAKAPGQSQIDHENGKITFEHPELFDPQKDIYIYWIDSEKIPPHLLKKIDEWQYAVEMDELEPTMIETKKAEEILKYWELTNWKKEGKQEINDEIKNR